MKEFQKIDDNTLKIIEEKSEEIVSTYVYDDLVSIRDSLIKQKDGFILEIDAKIAEANLHISEADKLGIVISPVKDELPIEELPIEAK